MQFHTAVGTGAGVADGPNGKKVPVVTLHIAKDLEVIKQLEEGDDVFDPDDEDNWTNIALSIRSARQLIEDLKEAVDAAIQGPPESA